MFLLALCVFMRPQAGNYKVQRNASFQLEGDWSHIVFTTASIGVDSFILLAGTLIAYHYLADRKKGLKFNLLIMYVRRYIRCVSCFNFSKKQHFEKL